LFVSGSTSVYFQKSLLDWENAVEGWRRGREEADWIILCRPYRDSILFRLLTRHLRAGLWIVPSLRDWSRCLDSFSDLGQR